MARLRLQIVQDPRREIARGAGERARWYPTVGELCSALPDLLHRGDRVLVNRLSRHTLGKGDLVVFSDSCNYIGRIEATPGDTIIWEGEQFLIPNRCHPKCTCGECHIFLVNMGRGQSLVSRGDIVGKASSLFK